MKGSLLSRGLALSLIMLVLGPLTFGTSPTPPPYHEYIVNGVVTRPSGGSKENFVVTLVGKFSTSGIDTSIELLAGFAYPGTGMRAATDTSGGFSLDVQSPLPADSLSLKASAVDQVPLLGEFFPVPAATETVMGDDPGTSSGCGGCNSVEPLSATVRGYRYVIPQQIIVIPY